MKKLIILSFFIASVNYLSAQNQQSFQYNPQKIKQLSDKAGSQHFSILDNSLASSNAVDTAIYLQTIKNANVYALPQDKMPCIKPDTVYAGRIPVKYTNESGLIVKQRGNLPGHIQLPAIKNLNSNSKCQMLIKAMLLLLKNNSIGYNKKVLP